MGVDRNWIFRLFFAGAANSLPFINTKRKIIPNMSKFKPVSSKVDFPVLERKILEHWSKKGIVEKYLKRNRGVDKKFSFLDGPITANNPMGVHHAWGRTYKDLWQRFFNMRGFAQRFQNGFDNQGLWVEVEVEKKLGFKSKKDIEGYGIDKFVEKCKEHTLEFAKIQTEQSKRLGYFMDWHNSYYTLSDENNYKIWHFLKTVNEKGWLYKGRDTVPWCPRCGTAISQHEILTEEYQDLTHNSVYLEYPIEGRENEYLLVWTTTPWTLPGNVAIAVDPDKEYVKATGEVEGNIYFLSQNAAEQLKLKIIRKIPGNELVGLEYKSPFDYLPRIQKSLGRYKHKVIATDPLILPILDEEGTSLVHIAPGAGTEDFQLGLKLNLPVIELIDETAGYLDSLGEFSNLNAKNDPKIILNFLKEYENGEYLFDVVPFTHKYPTCWRCKTELVWRVVDEWYIGMDKADDSGKTYREQMIDVAKQINWIPKWGLERELDWLKNMHDWLISKKRYWGLALPIWECRKCNSFEVVESYSDLKSKAVEGWNEFEHHSPHRPWIDRVKIKCFKCGSVISRIPDVGNPWLDAGIVPFSTMSKDWFPADFITESFPGQFKNWFYSLIAMSTVLVGTNPFKNVLGFASVRDEKGEEMHKSKGNAIEFNKAADKIGVDVMRWIYATQNPENNLNFGFDVADKVRRQFYLILWNSYKFFVDYAILADWDCAQTPVDIKKKLSTLDRWILAELTQTVLLVNDKLVNYDAMTGARAIEKFVTDDLSTWYIRRSRDRVGPGADREDERVFLSTFYGVLITLSKLLAPFLPFVSEEIYRNLTGEESVHLTDYPKDDKSLLDSELLDDMVKLRQLVEIGHAQRKESSIKLRQPLGLFIYSTKEKLNPDLEKILTEELNLKKVEYKKCADKNLTGQLDTKITPKLKAEGEVREFIRQIQQLRKEKEMTLKDKIKITTPIKLSREFIGPVLKQANADEIIFGEQTSIEIVK